MKKILVCFLVALCLVQPLVGSTYYVDINTGSDMNAGTSLGTAFLTIAKGTSMLACGDTLNIRATGSYNEQIDPGDIPSCTIGNTVTVQGYNGETPTLAPTVSNGYIISNSGDYAVFNSLILDGTNVTNGAFDVFLVVGSSASDNSTYQALEIKNSSCTGFSLDGDSNSLTNLNVHDNGRLTSNQCHGVYIGGGGASAQNNVISGGSYHDNAGFNIHGYTGGSGNINGTIIKNARIYRSGFKNGTQNSVTGECGALITDCASGCQFYNNLVYDNLGCGLQNAFSGGTTGLLVYYNTFYNNGNYDGQVGMEIGAAATNTTFQNNIARNNGASNYSNTGTGTTCTKNLINAAPGGCTSTVTTDPGFVNVSSGNFHLSLGSSSAVGAATCVGGTVPLDFDGITRGATCDAGAYEYTAATIRLPSIISLLRRNQN